MGTPLPTNLLLIILQYLPFTPSQPIFPPSHTHQLGMWQQGLDALWHYLPLKVGGTLLKQEPAGGVGWHWEEVHVPGSEEGVNK